MQFKDGASVYTEDGERVGQIDRVVIDPGSKEVTHLVVEKGFLFTEDKVVPISLIGPTREEKITLRKNVSDLEKLPDFIESNYIPTTRMDKPLEKMRRGSQVSTIYAYPPLGTNWSTGIYEMRNRPHFVEEKERNIPEDEVALKEGAMVITRDKEYIGDIEGIFTDQYEDRVTHLLISKGLITKEKKLVPVIWVAKVLEDKVFLIVDSQQVENIPEYSPQN